MDSTGFVGTALFEHRFWLQVLGDHARFLRDALSPEEGKDVQQATAFIHTFDSLLQQTAGTPTEKQMISLSRQAFQHAGAIRLFKLGLIRKHLTARIRINLTPTFINHMVNEAEEYIRILAYLCAGRVPPAEHPLHHHLVWLLDAAGHAGAIDTTLDAVEKGLKQQSRRFTQQFEHFYIKAVELAGYLRTCLHQFPALNRFNRDVKLELILFQKFIHEMEEMRLDLEALGTLSPLMADHMTREECYYLTKLARSSRTDPPGCDPLKPRTSP